MSESYEAVFLRLIRAAEDLERWDHFYRMLAMLTTWEAKARYESLAGRPYTSAAAFLSEIAGAPVVPYDPARPPGEPISFPSLEGLVPLLEVEKSTENNYADLLEYDDPPVDPQPPTVLEIEEALALTDRIINRIHDACASMIGYSEKQLAVWDALVALVFNQ